MNDFPYPPTHGGRLDVWGRVRALADLGHELDVLVTVKEPPRAEYMSAVAQAVRRIRTVRRASNLTGVIARAPVQVASRRALASVPLKSSYDTVLLEQEYVAAVLDNPGLNARRTILRVHNDEAAYYNDLASAERNWWKRAYYSVECRRFGRVSPRIFGRAGELWFISKDHHAQWCGANPERARHAQWLPAAIPGDMKPLGGGDGPVLIAGNLFQPTNLLSLQWYFEQVHPRLCPLPRYELWVAGSTRGTAADGLVKRLRSDARCRVYLNEPSLAELYANASVFVNPMLRGVSVKLKTLDAIRNGLPVVTTPVGLEGTGLESGTHALVARSASDMAGMVAQLLGSAELRRVVYSSAQAFLADRYDHKRRLAALLESS